jgi:hypothetical protein
MQQNETNQTTWHLSLLVLIIIMLVTANEPGFGNTKRSKSA